MQRLQTLAILVTDEAKVSSADIHNLGKSKKADIND
jgi:hypothetical protein